MKKALKILVIFALILSLLNVAGCKGKESTSSKSEESSQTTNSIQTSQVINNSTGATESHINITLNPSSQNTASEENIENYHSKPDYILDSSISTPTFNTSSESASSDTESSKVESSNAEISTDSQLKFAKKAISDVLDAIKTGDFETAENSLTGERPPREDIGFDDATINKIKSIFAELDYKIVSAKRKDATKVIVTVKITALNFKNVYRSYVKSASEIASNSPNLTPKQISEKIDKAFLKSLNEGKKEPVEKTVKLTVVGHGKNWKTQYSVDFSKACLGGIAQVAEALK